MTPQQLIDEYVAKFHPNETANHGFIQYCNIRPEMGWIRTLDQAMVFVADGDVSAPAKDIAKAAKISVIYGGNTIRNHGNRQPLAYYEYAKCHMMDGNWAYDCPNRDVSYDNCGSCGGCRDHGGNGGGNGSEKCEDGNGAAGCDGGGRNPQEVNATEATGNPDTGGQEAGNAGNI